MKLSQYLISALSAVAVLSSLAYAQSGEASDKIVVGYYVPWGKLDPSAINYDKLTHINYGFGILTKKDDPANISIDRYYDGNKIRQIVSLAKPKGVKVLISLGGWTGGQTFSSVAKDPQLRQKFIENALVFVRKNTKPEYDENPDGWDLDGIDIDWEYPAREAGKCNVVDKNDTANYLVLLQELREAMDKEFPNDRKLMSAAVRVKPFDGPDGIPLTDVSEFAQYLDYVNIMAYDINGAWSSTTGPNAPFNYSPGNGDPFSVTQAFNDWTAAKFPAEKLVMGLPFYGRSLTADTDMNNKPISMYAAKNAVTPKGDNSDSNEPNLFCNEGSVY
ncbi:glycoside hydrolase, partial [Basidiobolus meristosporus CBS 931.73]